MAKQGLSAHQFKNVYQDLGYDLAKLGCIMLNTEPIQVSHIVYEGFLYYAQDPKHKWIDGVVSEKVPHVTLLYGLLRSGLEMQKHVDEVLDYGKALPAELEIEKISFFESPYEEEPYYCLIAELKLTEQLLEANARLKFLPHIETFPGYKPHISLAYIVKNEKVRDEAIEKLSAELVGKKIEAQDLNYGSDSEE